MNVIRRSVQVLAGALAAAGVMFLASCATLPPWKTMPTGTSVTYGQIEDYRRALAFIAWSDDPGIITLTVDNRQDFFNARYGMIVDQPARTAIQEALSKYQEWARLAVDNQVEITREISSVTLPQILLRSHGWEAEGERQVSFVFNARLGGSDTPRTTLQIRTRSFFYGSDQINLSDQQAGDFAKYMQDESVDGGYQQAKKKHDALDMFK
ncbi:MAG TPA: hypothetical protein VFI08_02715 [Spirochaetia bacterium]|nr:hypothetical protein [Spirochaetia bacterium]